MKFGLMIDTHVDKWKLIQHAEELGFHRAWIPDSQMIWADCYVTMGLAAVNTKRILIGTGMTTPGTRIAPVTAHSIGSINQLAPGRVFLGIATGHTSMRLIGQPPISPSELREYIGVLRKLLDGEAVDYTYRGRTAEIQFMHRDRYYVNLDNRIPIYIAANGPKALAATGELGDGWMLAGRTEEETTAGIAQIRSAAAKIGRTLPADFLAACSSSACVLRRGEKLTDDRVVNQTGSMVTTNLHLNYEVWELSGRKDELILPHFANIWDDYVKRVANYSLPPESRFRQIHDGHATFLQEGERRFVTPEAIKASCLVGEPDEIVEQVRGLERAGLTEISLLPPADYQSDVLRDFAELVMPHFKED